MKYLTDNLSHLIYNITNMAAKPKNKPKSSRARSSKRSVVKKKPRRKRSKKHLNTIVGILKHRYFLYPFLLFLLLMCAYIIYLDIRITNKFEGKIWSLPSHVYARPLELFVGQSLSAKNFKQELELIGYHQVDALPTKPGQYRYWNNKHFELISREFHFDDGLQASQKLRIDFSYGKVRSLNGLFSQQPLALVRLEPAKIAGIYPSHAEDRKLVKLENVPDYLVLALLAVEDRRFYDHWGIDPRSIARALLANLSAGGTVQGGSTLTQQLVKNIFLSPERSLLRKINEAIMSLLLELHYDKTLILETYINEIYLGQDGSRAIHGFGLASFYYYDKPLNKLTKDQLAMLVGLVKGASWYSPVRHPERAMQRRNQVLNQMAEQGVISAPQLKLFKSRPLNIAKKSYLTANRFPAFVDLVKRQLRDDYAEKDLRSQGLSIFTTFDPLVQYRAEKSVQTIIPHLERGYKKADQLQTAVIVVSPENGEVQALVGDRNPRFPGFNRSLDAIRQVGSLIKPGIYLSALQHPQRYNLASVLDDSPLHLKNEGGKIWSPQNYDKKFKGDILLYEALSHSRNIPTVRLGLEVGLADIVKTLNALGIDRDVPPYPSMTLGAFSLSPFDVASMYQTLAAKGFNIPLRAIRAVYNQQGEALSRYPLKLEQTFDAESVYLINTVLNKVTQSGTAKSLDKQIPVRLAGKTGTTDNLRDSWFAGYSENRLAVVWLGRDDNQSTGLTGASGALKIWTDIMKSLPLDDLSLDLPETMENHWIDSETGGITEKHCQGAVELPFLSGTQPTQRAECKSRSMMDRLKNLFQ
jgi:penicillin-binding protein 1B